MLAPELRGVAGCASSINPQVQGLGIAGDFCRTSTAESCPITQKKSLRLIMNSGRRDYALLTRFVRDWSAKRHLDCALQLKVGGTVRFIPHDDVRHQPLFRDGVPIGR